jgi:hypothetical protein
VIKPRDRIELAPGVTLDGSDLVDAIREVRVRLNETAVAALSRRTPEEMAQALCGRFEVDCDRARADVIVLCARLNAALLANTRVPSLRLLGRWLWFVLMLAPLRQLPRWPPRRRAVQTTTSIRAFVSVARGTACVAACVSAATALPLAAAGALRFAFAVGLGAGVGVVLHEAGHAIALRGVPAALIVRGFRVSLLHPQLDASRERAVAAAGPLAAVAGGVAVFGLVQAGAPAAIAPAALVCGLHAVGLCVLGTDGRKLCAAR